MKTDINDVIFTSLGITGLILLVSLGVFKPVAYNPILAITIIFLFLILFASSYYIVKRMRVDGIYLSFFSRLFFTGLVVAGVSAQLSASAFYYPKQNEVIGELKHDHIQIKNQEVNDFKQELESCSKTNTLLVENEKIKQIIHDATLEKNKTKDDEYKKAMDVLIDQLMKAQEEVIKVLEENEKENNKKYKDADSTDSSQHLTGKDPGNFPDKKPGRLDIRQDIEKLMRSHSPKSRSLLEEIINLSSLPGRALGALLGFGGSTKRAVKNVVGSIAAEKIPNQSELYHIFSMTGEPQTLKIELLAMSDRIIAKGNVENTFKRDLERAIDKAIRNTSKRPSPDIQRGIARYLEIGHCDVNQILRVMPKFASEVSKAEQLARVKETDVRTCLQKITVK